MLTHKGEWAIDEIKVKIINDKLAWIEYEKYVVNAERHRNVVMVSWFERRKGITLESKISDRLSSLKSKLEIENVKIRDQKRLENLFNK